MIRLFNIFVILLLLLFNINANKNNPLIFPIIMTDIIIELRDGPIVIRKDIGKVAKFVNTSMVPCEKKGRFEMKLQSINDPILELGCSKLPNALIESKIVIIQRGKCSLHSKAMRVIDANAKAMIIVNDNDENFHAEFDSSEKSINQIKEEKLCHHIYINNNEELQLCLDEVKLKYLLIIPVIMIPRSIGLIYKKLLTEYSSIMVRLYDSNCKLRIDYTNYFRKNDTSKSNKVINEHNDDDNKNDNNKNKNEIDIEEINYFNEICSLLQMKLEYRSMRRLIDLGVHKYPHRFTNIDDIDTVLYNDKDKIFYKICINNIQTEEIKQYNEEKDEL